MLQIVARAVAGRRLADYNVQKLILVLPHSHLPRIRWYTSSILPEPEDAASRSPAGEQDGNTVGSEGLAGFSTGVQEDGDATIPEEPAITLEDQDTENVEEQVQETLRAETSEPAPEQRIPSGEGQISTAVPNAAVTFIASHGVTSPSLVTPEPVLEPLPDAIPPTIDTPHILPITNIFRRTLAPLLPEAIAPDFREPQTAFPLKEQVRIHMRTMANSLVIISADPTGDDKRGLLASSFNTVTLDDPNGPIVSFNIKLPSTTYDLIEESGEFEVSATWNISTAIRYANAPARGAEKYVPDMEDEPSNRNAGHLRRYRLFGLKCKWMKDKSIRVGDHMIMVGQVYDVVEPSRRHEEYNVLFYRNGQFGSFVPTPQDMGKNAKKKIRLLNAATSDESKRVAEPAKPTREDLYKDVKKKKSYKEEREEVKRTRRTQRAIERENMPDEVVLAAETKPKKERKTRRKKDEQVAVESADAKRLRVRGFEDKYDEELSDFLDPDNELGEMDYDDFEGNALQSSFIRESQKAKREKSKKQIDKWHERYEAKREPKPSKDEPAPHYAAWKHRIAALDEREARMASRESTPRYGGSASDSSRPARGFSTPGEFFAYKKQSNGPPPKDYRDSYKYEDYRDRRAQQKAEKPARESRDDFQGQGERRPPRRVESAPPRSRRSDDSYNRRDFSERSSERREFEPAAKPRGRRPLDDRSISSSYSSG